MEVKRFVLRGKLNMKLNPAGTLLASMFCATLVAPVTAQPAPHPAPESWRQLFNGKDLTGWQHVGEGSMAVENGMIVNTGKTGEGLLWWTGGKIGSSVIRVVYRMKDKPANSGVFIRIPLKPRETSMPVHYGYESNIEPDPARWQEDDYYATGSLYGFTKVPRKPDSPGTGWNVMEITIDGPRTIVSVNNIVVTDYKEGDPLRPPLKDDPLPGPRPDSGYIGIQNVGDEAIYFKEIAVRPLGGKTR